jgi:mRNA interferase RelE/StbE
MVYKVVWSHNSLRQLSKLEKQTADRITKKVDSIVENPFSYIERLVGMDLYKLRIGDYRVIMGVDRGKLVILVVEVGHRKNIYKDY